MLWLNYVAIVCMLLSVSARYISPASFWLIAFFGLGYPVILGVNLFFMIYWLIQMRWQSVFSFIAILLGIKTLLCYFQIDFSKDEIKNKDIKVMSYNSMLFDLYNWSKNAQSRNMILDMLSDENPDILCLQEFYSSDEPNDFHNEDTLRKMLNAKRTHILYTFTERENDHWGIATYTKFPIIKKGRIDFNVRSNNVCIYTDMLIGNDTVRVYNMHLQSIAFDKKDYKFLDEVNSSGESSNEVEKSKTILRRIKRAFIKRADQADIVANHIRNCKYKVIVCGDFNDTPASYAYCTIRGNLKDSFVEKGNGFEQTYAGKFPRFRIDYIFHSSDMECARYYKVAETLTDHYPIVSYLRWP